MASVVKFEVKSNRIRDIRVTDATTVADFREQLKASGFDVAEAKISVHRNAEHDVLVGKLNNYVLKPGDTVKFFTESNIRSNQYKLLELGRKLRSMRISDDLEGYCKTSEDYNKCALEQGLITKEAYDSMMQTIQKAREDFVKKETLHDAPDTDCEHCTHHCCVDDDYAYEDDDEDYDEEVENEDDYEEDDDEEKEEAEEHCDKCSKEDSVTIHDIKVFKDKDGITIRIKG